jgi:hypothetical protein
MKAIPLNAEIEAVAKRIILFENPVDAPTDPIRFVAYAAASATHEDMKISEIC